MNDNDPFLTMSPTEIAAMTERLVYSDEPVDEATIPTGPGNEIVVPRSVKMPRGLDKASKARANELGLSQSAYIRSLIEADIATAETGDQRPEWVREILAVIAHHAHTEHRQAS